MKHPGEPVDFGQHPYNRFGLQKAQIPADHQQGFSLNKGTFSDAQKVSIFLSALPLRSFRDVCGNRQDGASQLGHQSESLI